MSRRYFHLRNGDEHGVRVGPEQLRRLTKMLVGELWDRGYFQVLARTPQGGTGPIPARAT